MTPAPLVDGSSLLTIAAEIRVEIYKELFQGFTVHLYTEWSDIVQNGQVLGRLPHNVVEANVNAALLLVCKMIRTEGQVLYDQSVRFSLAHDTPLHLPFRKMYANDFYKRVTWLSLSEDHAEELDFTKSFPHLKKLEIEQGGNGKIWPMKPDNPGANMALNKGEYDEEFKDQIRSKYVGLAKDSWQRKALDSFYGNLTVTHFFGYYRRRVPGQITLLSGKVVGIHWRK